MKKLFMSVLGLTVVACLMLTFTMGIVVAENVTANGFMLATLENGTLTAEGTNGFNLASNQVGNAFAISQTEVDLTKTITFDVTFDELYGWFHGPVQQIFILFSDAAALPNPEVCNTRGFILMPHADGEMYVVTYREILKGAAGWAVLFGSAGENLGTVPINNIAGETLSFTFDLSASNNYDVLKVNGQMVSAYPDYNSLDFAGVFEGDDIYITFGVSAQPEDTTHSTNIKVTNVYNGDTLISTSAEESVPEETTREDTDTQTPDTTDETTPGDTASIIAYFFVSTILLVAVIFSFLSKKIFAKKQCLKE